MCTPTSFSFTGNDDLWHSNHDYPETTNNKNTYIYVVGKVSDNDGNTAVSYNPLPWNALNAGTEVYKFKTQFLNTFLYMSVAADPTTNPQLAINTWLNKSYSTINDGSALDKAHGWFGISKDNLPNGEENGLFPAMAISDATYIDYPSTLTITGVTEAEAKDIVKGHPAANQPDFYSYNYVNLIDLINNGKDIVIHSCAKAIPSL